MSGQILDMSGQILDMSGRFWTDCACGIDRSSGYLSAVEGNCGPHRAPHRRTALFTPEFELGFAHPSRDQEGIHPPPSSQG
eukprot:8877915-Pyramimonas_sp.AAC.1